MVLDLNVGIALALHDAQASSIHILKEAVHHLLAGLLGREIAKLAQKGGLAFSKGSLEGLDLANKL